MASQGLIAEKSYLRYGAFVRIFLASAAVLWGCGPKPSAPASVEVPAAPQVVEPLVVASQPLVHASGLGPWRLGMARHEVLQAFNCRRFIPERMTGGFQCSGWESPFGPRRVSFAFDESYRLSKLQLWISEQDVAEDPRQWAEAVWEGMEVLSASHDLSSATHPHLLALQREAFVEALEGAPSDMPFSLHVDVARFPDRGTRAWITAIATSQGRFAFLFVGR
ncbi:MAG: hypothetical protein VXW32_09085 [Myxococcota bacterium]|nr:hypothetical protein [Myxococcota bacterium]